MNIEEVMDAKCIQQLKDKMLCRLESCKASLAAGTIINENEYSICFRDSNNLNHFYIKESAKHMSDFINDDNINFDTINGRQLIQLVKALMQFGSTDIDNNETVVSYLMYLLGGTIEVMKY